LLDLDDIEATEMKPLNPVRESPHQNQSADLHQKGKTLMFTYFDNFKLI